MNKFSLAAFCFLLSVTVVRAKQPPTAPPVYDLVVVWCLVEDRALCKKPEEAIPIPASLTVCMRAGAFGMIREKVDANGKKWFAHVYCSQSQFYWFLEAPPKDVARSPWN